MTINHVWISAHLLNLLNKVLPEKIIDNHNYSLKQFMKETAAKYDKKGKKIMDIGAGETPYKKYFDKSQYLTQDVVNNTKGNIDYVCNSTKIPVGDSSFDYVICTQVLEHVPEPHLIIREMYRILKKGGKVFLTAPMTFEEHMLPYDYFRYTSYGLRFLAESNKFKVEKIKPQGGRFIVLAKQIQTAIPRILDNQYLIYAYYFLAIIPLFFIHLICYYLDKLDKKKLLTLNYECIFRK